MKQTNVYPYHILLPNGRAVQRICDVIVPAPITSFVGGGGKTSSMLALGTELAEQGIRVILTTTTRILPFHQPLAEHLSCIGVLAENGKLKSVADPDGLKQQCDILLIEADGSRGLPFKAPAAHEPVITAGTGLVIAVLGLTGIGKPIAEVCHRPKQVCSVLKSRPNDPMTPEKAAALLMSSDGLYKQAEHRRFAVILNQADGEAEQDAGQRIAALLPKEIPCVMTAYRRERL